MRFILFIVLFMLNTGYVHQKTPASFTSEEYVITEIGKEGGWYIIYARKDDQLFKILSYDSASSESCCDIVVGKEYALELESISERAPEINGIKLDAVKVDCYQFEGDVTICKEKDKGIFDLYFTRNLKALVYIE